MRRLSIKAVLVGSAADMMALVTFAMLFVFYVIVKYGPHNLVGADVAIDKFAFYFFPVVVPVMFACSVLGGYAAAWTAKHDELVNGALSSFLSVAIVLTSLISGEQQMVLMRLLPLLCRPSAALLGGYIRLAQKRHMKPRLM